MGTLGGKTKNKSRVFFSFFSSESVTGAPWSQDARRGVVVLGVERGHTGVVDVPVERGPAAVLAPAVVVVRAHVPPLHAKISDEQVDVFSAHL